MNTTDTSSSSAMKSMYGGLSDFSSLLTSALGSIDLNINNLHTANLNAVNLIEVTKVQVDSQAISLKNLEIESEQLRVKLEQTVKNLVQIENNVSSQLSDTTKSLHRELMTQRTSNKMDLHALKGNLKQSINDTIDLLADAPKTSKQNTTVYNANSTNEEAIKYLVEKVKYLEEMISLQHTVNKKLSETISNNEVVTNIYEELSDDITKLEALLKESKQDNIDLINTHMESMNMLKDTQTQELNELKATQMQQQKQIQKLLEAVEATANDNHRPRSHKKRTDSSKRRRHKDIYDTTNTTNEVDKNNAGNEGYSDVLTDDDNDVDEEYRSSSNKGLNHKKHQLQQAKVHKPARQSKVQKDEDTGEEVNQGEIVTQEVKQRRNKQMKNNASNNNNNIDVSLAEKTESLYNNNNTAATLTPRSMIPQLQQSSQIPETTTTVSVPIDNIIQTAIVLTTNPENESYEGSYDGSYDDGSAEESHYDNYLQNTVSKDELAQGLTESKALINTLRDEYKAKTNDLETSMNAFKRVAFMMYVIIKLYLYFYIFNTDNIYLITLHHI